MLFSRQILNGSQDFFFLFGILILIYFFKYETIETQARAFLTLIILVIGTVCTSNSNTYCNSHEAFYETYFIEIPIKAKRFVFKDVVNICNIFQQYSTCIYWIVIDKKLWASRSVIILIFILIMVIWVVKFP